MSKKKVTIEDLMKEIQDLKKKLDEKTIVQPVIIPQPYPVPYIVPQSPYYNGYYYPVTSGLTPAIYY